MAFSRKKVNFNFTWTTTGKMHYLQLCLLLLWAPPRLYIKLHTVDKPSSVTLQTQNKLKSVVIFKRMDKLKSTRTIEITLNV